MPAALTARRTASEGTTRWLTIVSLSVAVLSSSAAVFAQSESAPEGRFPVWPGLSVTPAVYFFTGYDTDSLRTATGGPSGEYYFAPQIEGWLDRGRVAIDFQDAISHQASGGARVWNSFHSAQVRSNGALFGVRGQFSHRNQYAPPTDFIGFEIGIRSRRIENTYEGEFRVQPVGHRVNAVFTAKRLGLRYDADERFRGSMLQFNLNRDTTIGSAQVGWAVTPLTSLSAAVNFNTDRFLFLKGANGRGRSVLFGVETRPLGMMTATAKWGQLTYTDLGSGRTATIPTFDTALILSRGRSILELLGTREIGFSFEGGYYLQTGLDTYLSMKFGKAFEPFVRNQWRRIAPQDSLGGGPSGEISKTKVGLAYRIGQLRIGPVAERYIYTGAGAFAGWHGMVFAILGSDNIVRMERPLIDSW